MTALGNGTSVGRSGSGAPASVAGAGDAPPWAPLRHPAFRWLWLGVLISSIGTSMQAVGAQWLLLDAPDPATWVSLVQAATTLPVMLLALPGGVLADTFDRRWLLFSVQIYSFVIGLLLALLTAVGQMTPALLLAFTVALGAGLAVQLPSWGATIPQLVPRTQLPAATRLDVASVSVARAIGPLLAGLVIAHLGGVPVVFALNAGSVVVLLITLLVWRDSESALDDRRERFVPALRAGGRYVWHEPLVQRILVRAAMFLVPGSALLALLPVIASQRLGLGADGYGVLFGAFGLGSILGALVLGRARVGISSNAILVAAGLLYGAAMAVLILVPSFASALAALVVAGLAWLAVTSTLGSDLQILLPTWVRARAISVYTVTFMGALTGGAVLSALVAGRAGPESTVLLAAVLVLAGAVAGLFWRLPATGHVDPQSAVYWPEARLVFAPEPDSGPVLVAVHFTVSSERQPAFLQAMNDLRRSRRRTGATRWELYRDGNHPDRFVELFSVPSWGEHLRQHEGRLTASDREVEEIALAFSDPPARADHLLPPHPLEPSQA